MHLLVLGGTWFVGHAIVTAAIDAGWEVTTFNRGTSDPFLLDVCFTFGSSGRFTSRLR